MAECVFAVLLININQSNDFYYIFPSEGCMVMLWVSGMIGGVGVVRVLEVVSILLF